MARISRRSPEPRRQPTHPRHNVLTLDPARGYGDHQIPMSKWYIDRRDFDDRTIEHSKLYQDIMRQHGIASATLTWMVSHQGVKANLSLQRADERAHFEDADAVLF